MLINTSAGYSQANEQAQERSKTLRLARLLDSSIRLPGGYRVGIDGVVGLIPGVGDVVGGALSSLILYKAYRMGLPNRALLLMGGNILIDSIMGSIPLVGDLFDFMWKSNSKNIKILDQYYHKGISKNALFPR